MRSRCAPAWPGGSSAHRRLTPAHHLHDRRQRDLEDKQHRGSRVPGVVQPGVPDTRVREQRLPLSMIRARVDRPAGGLSKYPAAVVPFRPGVLAFRVLRDLVST